MRTSLRFCLLLVSIVLVVGQISLFGQTYMLTVGPTWQNVSVTWATPVSISGMLFMITSGTCPSFATEVDALSGVMIQGTTAANGDVGTTGGSNSITPTGTVSTPAFTGSQGTTSAVSAGTPAGTNGSVNFTPAGTNGTASFTPAGTNSTASFTPAGTNGTASFTPTGTNASQSITSASTEVPVTSPTKYVFSTLNSAAAASSSPSITIPAETFTGSAGTVPAETFTGTAGTIPAETFTGSAGTVPAETFTGTQGTVPAESFTGSALGTHTHTLTPSGTISQPTFSGNAFDPHPSFMKVIFCAYK